ncbi:MAG: spore coat protein [Cohnella sp.]|nr:spore coat protein [Cohnella sp.]
MPFGAHETMETHEILSEKINCITHFNLYAKETNNPQLRDMIVRHQQEEILSYNQMVAYTHDYIPFRPIPPNTDIQGIRPQNIQYGLNNPPQFAPHSDASFSDMDIAMAMLWCHKNGARNATWASLEAADPNLRRMLMNSAATCANQAYEVFLFMNQQGAYQVPTMNDHTAKTFLHSYQPTDASLNAQYGVQSGQQQTGQQKSGQQSWQQQQSGNAGQSMGYGGQSSYGAYNQSTPNMTGPGGSALNVGSANSVLYGGGAGYGGRQAEENTSYSASSRAGSSVQNQTGDASMNMGEEESGSVTP